MRIAGGVFGAFASGVSAQMLAEALPRSACGFQPQNWVQILPLILGNLPSSFSPRGITSIHLGVLCSSHWGPGMRTWHRQEV